ncbi:probable peroxygenase 5 [Elaeis guineensis]|uniref:Probable peroxygenase 5 n=1 Tax=Elaeis guineensis var. tenera TaxID=51953 RepID=A0A6J0PGF1_ELAGV|nr:probable peroxygenase 5 [Elaeis guineensis]
MEGTQGQGHIAFPSSLSTMSSSSLSSHGEEEETNSGDLTPLQKHVAFFDRNNDGVIYPWETFQGCRAIGCGVALSTFSAFLVNGSLGPKTRTGKIPSPLLPIYIKNIQKGKHGSDSGVYDSDGRFVPAKFEEMFKRHAHTNPNALTSKELDEMRQANRVPKDYKGWFASWTEWKILFVLCKDKDGLLHKETIRAVYDGSLFLTMEKERERSQNKA